MSLSVSTLFGNFYSGSSSNSTSSSGTLYTSLSDYSSIRSGTYKKLLTAYYGETGSSAVKAIAGTTVNSEKDKKLTAVKADADNLYESSSKLAATSGKSLFKDADSVTDDIVSAVKSYVEDYNSLIEDSEDSSSSTVTSKVSFMTNQTSAYAKSLAKVGITIKSDNTLSIDEAALKTADINDVESLFNGSQSLAYQTSVRASAIGNAAQTANSTSLYGADGVYAGYSTSSAYNWYL